MQAGNTAIQIEHVWKRYGLPLMPAIRHAVARLRGSAPPPEKWSLRDVNFDIPTGATLGIIGRNGAGKSTLMKILAGVTPPTRGTVRLNGSLFPMIELNAGINTELTGRENVFLLGAVMGFSRQQMTALLPDIEAFCELGEWFDEPVWKYSSGMIARLGFGVAMHIDTDILLIDEVLAVGDLAFQQKCYTQLAKFKANTSKTIILISHNLRQVARLCDTVYIMERGEIIYAGNAEEAVNRYMQTSVSEQKGNYLQPTIETSGVVSLEHIDLFDSQGKPTESVVCGSDLTIKLHFSMQDTTQEPIFGVGITTPDLLVVAGIDSWNIGDYQVGEKTTVTCTFKQLKLLPGSYFVGVGVTSKQGGARLYAARNVRQFQVLANEAEYPTLRHTGLVALDAAWHFESMQT